MSDIKYCPNCQKEVSKETLVCEDCGFEFVPEKVVQVTNTRSKIDRFDPVPQILWSIIAFCFPLIGLVLFFLFRKEWPLRAESCKDGIVIGLIIWALVIIFAVFFAIDYKALETFIKSLKG